MSAPAILQSHDNNNKKHRATEISAVSVDDALLENIHQLTGKETDQDLIDKFNKYYGKQTREEWDAEESDSLSNIAPGTTESHVTHHRECRLVCTRQFLVLCCLMLWGLTALYVLLLLLGEYMWPIRFVKKQIPILGGWSNYVTFIVVVLPPYIVGTWGMLSAYCCKETWLKRFILTAPYFLLITFPLGFVMIAWVGAMNREHLRYILVDQMGNYYAKNESFNEWNLLQIWLRCCGIDSGKDWLEINTLTDKKVPDSCCKNKYGRHEHNETLKDICRKDVELNHAFSEGCLELALNFYTNVGAYVTAAAFLTSFVIIGTTIAGYKYHIVLQKLILGQFRYPIKKYMRDMFFVKRWAILFRKCRKARKKWKKKKKRKAKAEKAKKAEMAEMRKAELDNPSLSTRDEEEASDAPSAPESSDTGFLDVDVEKGNEMTEVKESPSALTVATEGDKGGRGQLSRRKTPGNKFGKRSK